MTYKKASKGKESSYRFFEIMQYQYNPDHMERDEQGRLTGKFLPRFSKDKPLLTIEEAIKVCEKHATIKKAAIFEHSRDVYTEEDEVNNPKHKVGWTKPTHWHIYLKFDRAQTIETIAKWFDVKPQYVKKGTGNGKFEDYLEYGYHESLSARELHKTQYDESAVIYSKGCNPREEVDALRKRVDVYKKRSLKRKEELRMKVQEEGMALLQAHKYDPLAYADDLNKLQQLRGVYLNEVAELPEHRINFYICPQDPEHGAGVGKTLFSHMLARSLVPEGENDQDIYYEAGSGKSAFQTYDGQPVIIFNDARAGGLLNTFGGRDELFAALDIAPSRKPVDKKYGSTTLIQKYTIINSIQPYKQFMDELAGTYKNAAGIDFRAEDTRQVTRRFPFVIQIDGDHYNLLCNQGLFQNTKEYECYKAINSIFANVSRVVNAWDEQSAISKNIQQQICAPVITKVCELYNLLKPSEPDESEFENYGKPISEEEIVLLRQKQCDAQCNECSMRTQSYSGSELMKKCNSYCIDFVKEKLRERSGKLFDDC